ncbi:hypothetical protein [Streptomyces sp. NPDC008150]|uniref:hypothetical protein n=1 Tax=Streptomyces sp. NPDC008150 TaxID=3364816 RepID=UPI0036EA04DC
MKPTGPADAGLAGSWGSSSYVVLHFTGSRVELSGGGTHCLGRAAKEDGVDTIRLTCDKKNATRTVGRVYGLTDKAMTVDWEGTGADSFFRSDDTAS